jgi:putative hemolysin
MKKRILIVSLALTLVVLTLLLIKSFLPKNIAVEEKVETPITTTQTTNQTGMANPASVYCKQQGGKLSIRKDTTGGEYGVCVFTNGVECDEWKFFRGECSKDTPVIDVAADTELIKLALVQKDGINLNQENVTVKRDTGKYAEGSITPKEPGVGGGYFFAAKTDTGWKIVGSGNGAIVCEWLTPYPDFPSDMIPECVDRTTGNIVQR